MKVLAVNGSPRKNRNTYRMLQASLDGASSEGASVEMIHLYDQAYKGCYSCYGCKKKETEKFTLRCTIKDDLIPILDKVLAADAIVLGSPIFFESVTGQMRSMLERLLFPVLTYRDGFKSKLNVKKPFGFVYTMNVPQDYYEQAGYHTALSFAEKDLERLFGHCQHICAFDTVQFDDYSKYDVTDFSERHKRENQEVHFDKDLKKAHDMGIELVSLARSLNIG